VSADDVLDPATVAGLRRAQQHYGSPMFIRRLADLFLENTPAKMDRIREAIAERDAASLERVSHTLKTNCAVLGAVRMAGACERLEAAAGRAAFDEADAAFRVADALLPEVLAAVSALAEASPSD
jgi:HPt (histidine-containing phosphotransfer) domain-containing protein